MLTKEKKDLIIVPCDFTEQSKTALSHASKIAAAGMDEVRLLHIINSETKSKLKKSQEGEEAIYQELKKWAEENQQETGVLTSYHAEEGSIFTTMGEYAKDAEASLMVMGTHGVKGIQHLVGAFAMKVISNAPVPVVVVQNKKIDAEGYRKIILPIDRFKHGKNKVAYTISLAKYFDAEVHVFEGHDSDEFIQNQISLNATHAKSNLEKHGVRYIEVTEKSGEGAFTKQLIRYASEINADLVTISSEHDTQGVADLILGNNEVQIINNDSQIAVMCVNPVQNTSHLGIL